MLPETGVLHSNSFIIYEELSLRDFCSSPQKWKFAFLYCLARISCC